MPELKYATELDFVGAVTIISGYAGVSPEGKHRFAWSIPENIGSTEITLLWHALTLQFLHMLRADAAIRPILQTALDQFDAAMKEHEAAQRASKD